MSAKRRIFGIKRSGIYTKLDEKLIEKIKETIPKYKSINLTINDILERGGWMYLEYLEKNVEPDKEDKL